MQVQFLIDQKTAGSDKLLSAGLLLPPGARHDKHRHPNCDEFFVVINGSGHIYTDTGREPSSKATSSSRRRGHWHGFDNTGKEDVRARLGMERRGIAGSRGLRNSAGRLLNVERIC